MNCEVIPPIYVYFVSVLSWPTGLPFRTRLNSVDLLWLRFIELLNDLLAKLPH